MLVALISQSKGLALLDNGRQMHILSATHPDKPQMATPQRLKSFMDARDIEPLEVQDVTALVKHLHLRRTRERLLECVLTAINGELAADVRAFAAQELANSNYVPEHAWVKGVLLSAPLPEGADPIGATAFETPFREFFAGLPAQQEKIRLLARAWGLLPADLFCGEESANANTNARARAVRQGVFRALLAGDRDDFTPFTPTLTRYAKELQQSIERSGRKRDVQPDWLVKVLESDDRTFVQFVSPRPWRAAWLHCDWPRLESLFAFNAAARLASSFSRLAGAPLRRRTDDTAWSHLLQNCWYIERNSSRYAAAVDQIEQLKYTAVRKEPIGQIRPSEWKHLESHLMNEPLSHRKIDSETLKSYIQHFFGGNKDWPDTGSQTQMQWHARTADEVDDWETQNRQPDFARLGCEIPGYRPARRPPGILAGERIDPTHLEPQTPASVVERAIEIYSLDRVFQDDGAIVIILQYQEASESHNRSRAVMVNLRNSKQRYLKGALASLLNRLRQRLVADLHSGLPLQQCGWTEASSLADEVAQGASDIDIYSALSGLRQQITSSGFSADTLESHDDMVRLNPRLATPMDEDRQPS